MDSLYELLMVNAVQQGANDPGRGDILANKLKVVLSARGLPQEFVDHYCRYNAKSFFLQHCQLSLKTKVSTLAWVLETAQDFVRRLKEFARIFNLELTPSEWLIEEEKYFLLVFFDQVHSAIKLQINFIFCKFYGESLPAGTYIKSFFPRKWQIRFRCAESRRQKHREMLYTLFQGLKKGLVGGFPTMVFTSLDKHRVALTTKAADPSPAILDRIDDLCERIAKEFHPKADDGLLTDRFSLGTKATIESGFAAYGELGYYQEQLEKDNDSVESNCNGYLSPSTEVCHVRPKDFDPFIDPCEGEPLIIEGRHMFRKDQFLEVCAEPSGPYSVEPKCIIEPLKVRIITAPEIGAFSRIRQIQKKLWNFLAHHRSGFFDLIGEPLQRTHLWKLALDWIPGEKFASGDFSAATDNLKKIISERILKHLLGDYFCNDPLAYKAALETMLENIVNVDYKAMPAFQFFEGKTREETRALNEEYFERFGAAWSFKQANGQLMGNVLSFPILCIANYLAYHIAHEIHLGKRIPLWEVPPVRINGDDILFKCKQSFYDVWMKTLPEFGFFPSLGKNFFSDKMIQINSVLYAVHTAFHDHTWKLVDLSEVKYVNFGLITFRGKQDCSQDLTLRQSDFSKDKWGDRKRLEYTKNLSGKFVNLTEIKSKLCLFSEQMNQRVMLVHNEHTRISKYLFPHISSDHLASRNRCYFRTTGIKCPEGLEKLYPSVLLQRGVVEYKGLKEGDESYRNLSKNFKILNSWRVEVGLDPILSLDDYPDHSIELEMI